MQALIYWVYELDGKSWEKKRLFGGPYLVAMATLFSLLCPADKCKILQIVPFMIKAWNLAQSQNTSWQTFSDLSRDPNCVHLLSDVIHSVFCMPFGRCFSTKNIERKNNLQIYIDQLHDEFTEMWRNEKFCCHGNRYFKETVRFCFLYLKLAAACQQEN